MARIIASDIKLAHSVFAMPFAILAAFMAARPGEATIDWREFVGQLALIVAAMVLARTVAMLANRLLDRRIDQANPRTAQRAIPSGRLSAGIAFAVLAACTGGFVLVCAGFGVLYGNWWPAILALPALGWVSAYPLLKRFTWLSHLYLGSSLAVSPVAAAIAIEPLALTTQPALWLLAGMVLCWVAGFDIIYALQDVDVDQQQGLSSIPARFGRSSSLRISRALHVLCVACLVAAMAMDSRLRVIFAAGVMMVAILLLYEHLTVARWGTSKVALAFFTLNGVISCVLGALGIVDILTA
ncbi:MAG: 4-hydroxybenzoate octaprenyltransferase [Phycisphaerales bacterium]